MPRSTEKGSALLIVFVFAAIIAIMLYMEMPVVVFEAQRQKEQLLIDRGNEYARAVKLFVRKTGTYPGSLEALENTNQMRFLRRRYKDPFTGKDDWRLLHAGPGGVLLDSKVKPLTNQQNGSGSASGAATGSAGANLDQSDYLARVRAVYQSFGSTGFGTFGSNANADQVVVPTLPQRPPEMPANSSGAPADAAAALEANQNPMTPLIAPGQTLQIGANPQAVQQPASAVPAQPANALPGATPAQTIPPPVASIQQGEPSAQPGSTPQQQQPTIGGDASNPNIPMRVLLANPNTPPPQSTAAAGPSMFPSSASNMRLIMSGGIAGVASHAEGHSIKTVNDQSDYSLWEFYYDPTKDLTRGLPTTAQPAANPNAAQPNAAPTGFGSAPQPPVATPPPSGTVPANPPPS